VVVTSYKENVKKKKLEVRVTARREAARRRKSEWKVNLLSRNTSRSNGSWRMTPKRTTWRMDLRQLTVYEHFGWVNMRAITFLFVDQSSSCGLEKFGEDIPTSPEVIGAHMLNFRPKLKFLQLNFFRGPPSPFGVR